MNISVPSPIQHNRVHLTREGSQVTQVVKQEKVCQSQSTLPQLSGQPVHHGEAQANNHLQQEQHITITFNKEKQQFELRCKGSCPEQSTPVRCNNKILQDGMILSSLDGTTSLHIGSTVITLLQPSHELSTVDSQSSPSSSSEEHVSSSLSSPEQQNNSSLKRSEPLVSSTTSLDMPSTYETYVHMITLCLKEQPQGKASLQVRCLSCSRK